MKSRRELTQVTAARYRRCRRNGKSAILDEFTASTGYNRAYAALLLREYGSKRVGSDGKGSVRLVATKAPRRAGGRPALYGQEVATAVVQLWQRYGYVCGKRLKGLIRDSLPFVQADRFLKITAQTKEALARISAASIDRFLKAPRKAMRLKGTTHTRAVKHLMSEIPIRTFSEWSEVGPGHVQLDLVGHDGGNSGGDFCCTLSVSDVCLQWTERRAIRNRAQRWVQVALEEIRSVMPMQLLELHPDNGSEFINDNLVRYCRDTHLRMTRSRPGRKNDNCYVEQKNFDTVRKIVGYFRYDSEDAVALLNRIYSVHGLLLNYFVPSQKLLAKTRIGSTVHKRYDAPLSPAQRLLKRTDIPLAVRRKVARMRTQLNPLELASEVARLQDELIELAHQSAAGSTQAKAARA